MESTPQRRKRRAGPPSQLMVSYQAMTRKERRKLQLFGAGMMSFAIVFPMVLVIWQTPPLPFWLLDLGAFFAGALFVWPPGGILLLESLPDVARKLIPSGRLAAALERVGDRRGSDDE